VEICGSILRCLLEIFQIKGSAKTCLTGDVCAGPQVVMYMLETQRESARVWACTSEFLYVNFSIVSVTTYRYVEYGVCEGEKW